MKEVIKLCFAKEDIFIVDSQLYLTQASDGHISHGLNATIIFKICKNFELKIK